MPAKFATSLRNAILDSIESHIGTSPVLRIRSGSAPTNVSDADTGTVLSTIVLPSDWLAAASGGVKSKSGTWEDASADATGTAGHFRIYQSDGTTTMIQGSVTATGGGGQLELNSTSLTSGQPVTITSASFTAGNNS
jgi:hypothetical protein